MSSTSNSEGRQDTVNQNQNHNQNHTLPAVESVIPMEPPIVLKGKVARGFGRGGKELGVPTANLELDDQEQLSSQDAEAAVHAPTGVYFGWAKVHNEVYPMVTSIGWNPYYKNEKKTIEPHILHKFEEDFYGAKMEIVICGFVRDEWNFPSLEALIAAINNDIEISKELLATEKYSKMKSLL